MTIPPEIAIIGAGPAGLTAAVILGNRGMAVRVYEREASGCYRSQGGSLDLHEDSGQEALRQAGMLDRFTAVARFEDQATRMIDPWTGDVSEAPQHGEDGTRPEIDRGVLRDLLLSSVPSGAVEWGRALERVEDDGAGRKLLVFQDGSTVTADIVIGADGAWSRVRRYVTPALPEYSGITFLEGWLDPPSPDQDAYVGRGTAFSFGGKEAIFAQRNGFGRICIYAAVRRPREWFASEMEHFDVHAVLASTYGHWASQPRSLLTGCATFTERPIYQLPVGTTWEFRDGAFLVGDAAHLMPPVGVGVNLAMLDASDMALAIVQGDGWRETTRAAQGAINKRAAQLTESAITGFQEWFAT